MSEPIKKLVFARKEEPGLLEKLGAAYYRHFGKKSGTDSIPNLTIDQLPADVTLQALASNITVFAAIIAFAIGALTTFVTVWIEWTYHATMPKQEYYIFYGSVMAVMLRAITWTSLRPSRS